MAKKTRSLATLDNEYATRRFDEMWAVQQKYKPFFKVIRDFVLPYAGVFEKTDITDPKQLGPEMLDTDPWSYAEDAAAGLKNGILNPGMQWFEYRSEDPELDEQFDNRAYLELSTSLVMSSLERSGFYDSIYQSILELVTFGTSAILIDEDLSNKDYIYRFESYTAGEFSFGVGADGKPNSFCTLRYMNASQIDDEYGEDGDLPQEVLADIEKGKFDTLYEVCHLIERNIGRKTPSGISVTTGASKEYVSVHWIKGNKEFLRVGGYDSKPFVVSRWQKKSNMLFGISSPGWKAIGNSKLLQKITEDQLVALAKEIDPPMLASDGIDEVYAGPGGITRSSGDDLNKSGVKPAYQISVNHAAVQAAIDKKRDDIKRIFYYDKILMITSYGQREMTAEEVVLRNQEKLAVLDPILTNLQTELLAGVCERVLDIMEKNGQLPEKPSGLGETKTLFNSIFSAARRKQKLNPLNDFATSISLMPESMKEQISSALDPYSWLEVAARAASLPNGILKDRGDWEGELQQQAAQAQEQQAMAQAQQGAGIAKDLARAKTGEENALTGAIDMMGGGEVAQ